MTTEKLTYQVVRPNSEHDKETEQLITFSSGMKNTGGYTIQIESVEYNPDTKIITVNAKDLAPKPTSMVTQAFTAPSITIKVPKKDSTSHTIHWLSRTRSHGFDEL